MLDDLPDDPARLALAFRAIEAQMKQAAHRREGQTIDWAWLNDRHEQFEAARRAADAFARSHAERPGGLPWARRAWGLVIDSFETEAALAAAVSPVRAGGLRLRQSRELTALLERDPDHPAVTQVAGRLFNIAERIAMLEQRDAAIQVLNQVPVRFPDDAHAPRAMLRIAQLYAADLASPLRAVETYQEYLALTGTDVSSQVYQIARDLADRNRYVEALHVYGVFVDSFPRDSRAAAALLAIGSIHQTNRAWTEAMVAFERIFREYPGSNVIASARLANADCHINLSQWTEAQRAYERFVEHHAGAPQTALARERIELLKNLARFQDLLADEGITRNKDDAQFQIGRIALERLDNPVKAIEEFEKVVAHHPDSQWADNAQLEIGKALLGLNRLEDAREALLKLVERYPNSALADQALYLVGQSYEQEAERLAAATSPGERQRLVLGRQEAAYQQFQGMNVIQDQRLAERRAGLVKDGRLQEAELQDAYGTFRFRGDNVALGQFARIAEIETEREGALQAANRQDRINDAYRSAAAVYLRAATDYPLGERTAEALLRAAEILQAKLKDHDTAMATYQRIVEFFPASPTAEDAAWKVAQNHQRQGDHVRAVESYRDFIRKYPASGRVPDALFATAEVLERLDRWIEAMDAYETFTRRFPDHPRAAMATEQVNWIKAYRR